MKSPRCSVQEYTAPDASPIRISQGWRDLSDFVARMERSGMRGPHIRGWLVPGFRRFAPPSGLQAHQSNVRLNLVTAISIATSISTASTMVS